MEGPDLRDIGRIASAIGERPQSLDWSAGHGAPSNRRYTVTLRTRTVFAKVAAFDYTADWLRIEHHIYERLGDRSFLPRLLGWDDDGTHPVLVLEDLSEACWPPPWDSRRVDAVLTTLEDVHATPPPDTLGSVESVLTDIREGWDQIREDPGPVLALGVCSRDWLAAHQDTLEASADAAVIDGDTFVHVDVRSDNLCFVGDRAVLVDWNWASVGDPVFDVAAWLPSLAAEGGPRPWEVCPEADPFASLLAGFFLAHCVRPTIPQAPHVRALQEANGRAALPWAARALGLPAPDLA
jgi:hypothetical protein